MGLDMYLTATARAKSDLPLAHHTMFPGYRGEEPKATDGYFDARALADQLHLPADNAGQGNYGSTEIEKGSRSGYVKVTVQAGYWRKANHIHQWFVQKVQNGTDECEPNAVSIEQLLQLKSDCEAVLEASKLVDGEINNGYSINADGTKTMHVEPGKVIAETRVAEQLLPTTTGFFFGGTDYDEWYYRDCEHTIAVVDACLAAHAANPKITFTYQSSW